MSNPYGRAGFRVVLNVEGKEYEISQFDSEFALNAIPQAQCLLAVGREVRSLKPAEIHGTGHQLAMMKKSEVFIEAKGAFSPTEEWPEGRKKIFDGYLTGQGYRRSGSHLQMSLSLVHWLSDLSYSTMLSETSHPGNPSSYTFRASPLPPGSGAEASQAGILSQSRAIQYFNNNTISSDLWGKAILPFFLAQCDQDTMLAAGATGSGGGGDSNLEKCLPSDLKPNNIAKKALERFELDKPWCVPLQLNDVSVELAQSIEMGVMKLLDDGAYYQSFWDNLVSRLASTFMFGIVPRVDKALVAPIIPGLREIYHRKIYDVDQDYVELTGAIPRLIRGVGLSASMQQGCFSASTQNDVDPESDVGIGGCYQAKDENGKPLTMGQFLVMPAPLWLAGVPFADVHLSDTIGDNSATTPSSSGPKSAKTPAQAVRDNAQIFSSAAHAEYMRLALQGRQGLVTGKLRFDIAPGSNVWIEGVGEKFIGNSDKLGENLVGMVSRVSCGLNAEQGKASTGFTVGYARTEKENENPQTSTARHPLYEGAFKGAPLVDDYEMK